MNTYLLVIIFIVAVVLLGFIGSRTEKFYNYTKDKQKVGINESDNGKQPKSTWNSNNLNYETCYNTATRSGNNMPRTGTYFCDTGSEGEQTPLAGMYAMDLTNYKVIHQKIVRGQRLSGDYMVNGKTYTFDQYGRPTNEHMTLDTSKRICDGLGARCAGFILAVPGKRDNYLDRHTYFLATLEDGFEDPNTYDNILKGPNSRNDNKYSLTSWYNFTSYIKLDPDYKENKIAPLMIPSQSYERRTCSIEQNPDYDLDYMSGTLDDCKARCDTSENCYGFNRDRNANDDDVAACQLKKISFDEKRAVCPQNYRPSQTGDCVAGWSWECGEDCARNNCAVANGTWIPLDYSSNPYTCRMPDSTRQPVCQDAANRQGLVSYVRKGGMPDVRVNCPIGFENSQVKANFYLVTGASYQMGQPVLARPDSSRLQPWYVDQQWYTIGMGPNLIAEQIRDFVKNKLGTQPSGTKMCALFNSGTGSPSDKSVLAAVKMSDTWYTVELWSSDAKMSYGSWNFS